MAKLNEEAIDEIVYLLNEVKDVVRLLKEFGIYINSDSWLASTFGGEDILRWKRKDFEKINEVNWGDKFYIGGNVVTGNEHEYKNEYIIAPKELAEIQGRIFEEYLKSIIKSNPLKHFKLEFVDEFGLTENCGWEHYLRIDATIQKSALEEDKKKEELKYIPESIKENLNNYELLVFATEEFVRFMYFLEIERECEKMKIKIGDFEYDDWKADIYCILDEYGIRFEHIRDFDEKGWCGKTLTEQLIYAWDFKHIDFNIDFDIINNYVKALNNGDRYIYDSLYDEVHCRFW